MIKNKRIILLMMIMVIMTSTLVYADTSAVVTLGENLSEAQKDQMLELFGVDKGEATILSVNNTEERLYLEGIASDAQLGTRTISSAYVELLDEGSGIILETHNINWVTSEMYMSALVTAGVKDARVIAAAPFAVSGTGALTGVLKAFEQASGVIISEDQKKIANEEVFQTGDLGEEIGQDEASELMRVVKERVVSSNMKDISEIEKLIREIAEELNIELTDEQVTKISQLMIKISTLELDTEQIKSQLKNVGKKIDEVLKSEQVQNVFQRIFSALKAFFSELFKSKTD